MARARLAQQAFFTSCNRPPPHTRTVFTRRNPSGPAFLPGPLPTGRHPNRRYGPDPRGDGLVGAVGAGSRAASMQQRRQHGAGGRQQRGNSGGGSGAGGSGTDTEADETAEGGALGRAADAAAACDAAAAVSAAAYCPVMPNATFPSDHWAVGVELVLLGGCGGR